MNRRSFFTALGLLPALVKLWLVEPTQIPPPSVEISEWYSESWIAILEKNMKFTDWHPSPYKTIPFVVFRGEHEKEKPE